jgi:hypothetical protein
MEVIGYASFADSPGKKRRLVKYDNEGSMKGESAAQVI